MKRNTVITGCVLIILGVSTVLAADLNTIMMEATCKIGDERGPLGTGFVIGKPDKNNPLRAFYTLVTADHVLRAARGDTVVLTFRQKQEDESWKRIEIPVQIRNGTKELWQKHPEADVAAMFIRLPNNVVTTLLTTDFLMDDAKLKEYEIHPGLELLCLGYPFGVEANAQGFPILRSGRIASYPIIPTKDHKTFLFDFPVFLGNSGGPVYFVQHHPTYGGVCHIGTTIYGVIGLVVEARYITEKIQKIYETTETAYPLQLGEVIHASFIKELINSMDAPKR